MVVPLAARWVAAAVGILLVLTGWQSVIGTLIVPRPVGSWLTRMVDRLVLAALHGGDPPGLRLGAARPDPRHPGRGDPGGAARGLARHLPRRVHAGALAVPRAQHHQCADRRRVIDLHPRLRRAARAPARPWSSSSRRPPGWWWSRSRSATCRRCTPRSTGGRPTWRCSPHGPACRASDRNCSPASTTPSAPACPRSTRCPSCTSSGSAGRPTSRRATRRTCRSSASARRSRTRRG